MLRPDREHSMYESCYGLQTKPFELLPDSDFLYPGSTHRAAYSLLEYGIINEAPFVVLTGDPGMGKTSLLRKLISEHREKYSIGLVTNARYDIEHLLPWILLSFGLSSKQLDPIEAYHLFSEFLIQQSKQHRRVILIIDEAQNLGTELLEELRLLSNVNDGKPLKLQIILSGQPALHTLLQRIDMIQFAQRVVLDYHLEPLSEVETGGCIRHRLQIAGGHPSLFTDKACALVYRLTRGNPRLINQVCDMALTHGFAEQATVITSKFVAQAAIERGNGGILPLDKVEEINNLADSTDDQDEIPAPFQPPQPSYFHQKSRVNQSTVSPDVSYSQGVALRKEGRFEEAIEAFYRASHTPSYSLRALALAGLCYKEMGENHIAIGVFHTALRNQSAPLNDVINVQYFLARTFESVGKIKDALSIYQRIDHISPNFKDVGVRLKRLTVPLKPMKNRNCQASANDSWFDHVLQRLHQLVGSRK
jgi:type II secretory pathway predicted ATPase ExeA